MRQYGILLILALVLSFIAWQARTGVFRRKNPGEPTNKYMRAAMESPQLSEADAACYAAKAAGRGRVAMAASLGRAS